MIFAAYTATILYLTGFLGLFPSIPLALLGILAAIAYAVYLLCAGLPNIMHIPFEQGFMMATAIVAVGLVVLVSMKVMTIVLWDMGLTDSIPGFLWGIDELLDSKSFTFQYGFRQCDGVIR
ncbi:YIP1 family protein [Kistimonas asteriae]|uniref:YIP1 family protein n=1 Tax=Kistimonas asteriae TaxID=517724 RepID=UPI001BADDA0C|nr:YIP1 family protein [Kistimonas asteriae]